MKEDGPRSLYVSYNAITEPITQSQVIPYLTGLSKRGIKFYLLTFEKKRMTKEEISEIRDSLRRKFEGGRALEWFSLRYHKRPVVPATIFDIMAGWLYAFYIAATKRIEIVHARAIVAALIGYPVAKVLSKRFIFDTRGIDSEEYVDAGAWRRGGAKHRVTGFLERMLVGSSDHIVVLTNRFLEILKNMNRKSGAEFSVIPCAVDTDKFRPQKGRDLVLPADISGLKGKFVIVYEGSLGTWYMLAEMVRFFKTALKTISNAHFLILTQTDKHLAQDAVRENSLDMRYVTIDTVSHDSIGEYLSLCDAGIFFIKPVFSKISSSPVKFGEYLATGLPVILNYGIGDTEDIVLDNRVGVIVEGFDEAAYDKALGELAELMKDPGLAARCRLTAERCLSLKAAVQRYEYIYRKLTKG